MDQTQSHFYFERLKKLQFRFFKTHLILFNPYRIAYKVILKGNVLEVGSGIGRVLNYIRPRGIGVDHNVESVNFSKSRDLEAYSYAEFCDTFSFKTFDTLLYSHIFEHVNDSDQLALLKQYVSYLKPKGKIVVICPQEKGFKSDSTHIRFVSRIDIVNFLLNNGFSNVKSISYPLPSIFGSTFVYNENIVWGFLKD
jgi:SAM-dependent methyltransferase